MSKAVLYAANSSTQTLNSGSTVNLGTPIHGFGHTCCNKTIDVVGGNLTFRAGGLYTINVSATVTGSAAGTVTLTIYQDGVATASLAATNVAAANEAANISLVTAVNVNRCTTSTVTIVATTTAGTISVSNPNTVVVKES